MPIREVKDLSYNSGYNAAANSSPLLSAKPWLAAPRLEPYTQTVLDFTYGAISTSWATIGKLLVEQWSTSNTGGGYFVQSTSVAQALPAYAYGAVLLPAGTNAYNASGLANQSGGNENQALIVCIGDVQAQVATTSIACGVGTPLVSDGSGNLIPATASQATTAGVVLAVSKGSLSTSLGPSLVNVRMGGY